MESYIEVKPSCVHPLSIILSRNIFKVTYCYCPLISVCALAVRPGLLISGSWDKTARIWRSGDTGSVTTLSGHTAAIWAVEVLDCSSPSSGTSGILTLTGSADKTIKLWQGDSPLQLFKGHTDCVRALAVVDSSRFLSAANDATIRLWVVSGECLATYYGHTNYIYG